MPCVVLKISRGLDKYFLEYVELCLGHIDDDVMGTPAVETREVTWTPRKDFSRFCTH